MKLMNIQPQSSVRKPYIRMEFNAVETECAGTILNSSVTSVSIKINEVEVEEFEQGFGTTPNDDFKEISFD